MRVEFGTATDPARAEELIRAQLALTGNDAATIEAKVQESLDQPPNVITMDFASASRQVRGWSRVQSAFWLCRAATIDRVAAALTHTCPPQAELEKQARWVGPTAVTLSTAYLLLEALLTGQPTTAALTELAAICAMDAVATPWKRCSMQVCG